MSKPSFPNDDATADKFVRDIASGKIDEPEYLTKRHAELFIEGVEGDGDKITADELQETIQRLHDEGRYEGSKYHK
jgi:hypothetical protein